jgi:hypothetical protein
MATLSLKRTRSEATVPDSQPVEKGTTVIVRGRRQAHQVLTRADKPGPRQVQKPVVAPVTPVKKQKKAKVRPQPPKAPAYDRTPEYARSRLAELWPDLFGDDEGLRLLKCSIGAELRHNVVDRGYPVSTREVKRVIQVYCLSSAYLVATREGAPRYDTDGSICGYVTADQEAWAHKKLRALIAIPECSTIEPIGQKESSVTFADAGPI